MADTSTYTTLRIPGAWPDAGKLVRQLPDGFQLTRKALVFPSGAEVEMRPMMADKQFPKVFACSCLEPATDEEMEIINNYVVNVCLTAPGGSMESAYTMMQAGAAIVRAGGAGVFIDNSALSHGGANWLTMEEDGGVDALCFAFVNIVRGSKDLWTVGMHTLGLRDVIMPRAEPGADEATMVDVVLHLCNRDKPIEHGHVLDNDFVPRLKALVMKDDNFAATSPMHNPYGRLKLVNVKNIAESN